MVADMIPEFCTLPSKLALLELTGEGIIVVQAERLNVRNIIKYFIQQRLHEV